MIRVGDKFVTGFGHIVRMIRTEDDIGYFERIDDNEIIGKCHIQYVEKEWIKYIDFEDYEQQKQRADELEKRWSELKNAVKEFHQEAIIEVSKCKDEGDKGIVYACEKILGKISDLEEDGE